jgi:hypothetical protein
MDVAVIMEDDEAPASRMTPAVPAAAPPPPVLKKTPPPPPPPPPAPDFDDGEPETIFDVEVMEEPDERGQPAEYRPETLPPAAPDDGDDFASFFDPAPDGARAAKPASPTGRAKNVSETFMVPQDGLETADDFGEAAGFARDEDEDSLSVDSTDMADIGDMLDDLDDE